MASNPVLNNANYLLVNDGEDKAFSTTDCAGGLQGDDAAITFESINYDAATFTATLNLSSENQLNAGQYRLLVCGSTSLFSYWDDKLDGNFDSVGGDDFMLNFTVSDDELCVPIKAMNSAVALICL